MWTYEPKCGHFGKPFLIGWSLAVPHLAVPSRTGHQLIFYIPLHLAGGRLRVRPAAPLVKEQEDLTQGCSLTVRAHDPRDRPAETF